MKHQIGTLVGQVKPLITAFQTNKSLPPSFIPGNNSPKYRRHGKVKAMVGEEIALCARVSQAATAERTAPATEPLPTVLNMVVSTRGGVSKDLSARPMLAMLGSRALQENLPNVKKQRTVQGGMP